MSFLILAESSGGNVLIAVGGVVAAFAIGAWVWARNLPKGKF